MKRAAPFFLVVAFATAAVPAGAGAADVPFSCRNVRSSGLEECVARVQRTAAPETLPTCAALRRHERETFNRFNRAVEAIDNLLGVPIGSLWRARVHAKAFNASPAAVDTFDLWHTALVELNRRTLGGECE